LANTCFKLIGKGVTADRTGEMVSEYFTQTLKKLKLAFVLVFILILMN